MDIKEYLKRLNIKFKEFKHKAVFTVEEAKKQKEYYEMNGHTKNLFLKDRTGRNFYLVIISAEERLNMDELGKMLNCELKFANEKELNDILKIKPGCVGVFALINDNGRVEVLIDKEIWDNDFVSFHPNINTETLEINKEDFHEYINSLKNKVRII